MSENSNLNAGEALSDMNGVKSIPTERVREAVNAAVESAAYLREHVAGIRETTMGEPVHESLAASIAAEDVIAPVPAPEISGLAAALTSEPEYDEPAVGDDGPEF